MILKGILSQDADTRRKEILALIPDGRDFNGRIVFDQSFLLKPFVPPLAGVVDHFALMTDRQAVENEIAHCTAMRIRERKTVRAEVVAQFENAREEAVGILLRAIPAAGLQALYEGKNSNLNLTQPVTIPLAALYGTLFDKKEIEELVSRMQPKGREAVSDEAFAAGVATRREALEKIRLKQAALETSPGRFDEKGRDLWLSHTGALLWWNERATLRCDSCGRRTENPELVAFLDALNFGNTAEIYQNEWFVPTNESRLYHSPTGGHFLNWRSAQPG